MTPLEVARFVLSDWWLLFSVSCFGLALYMLLHLFMIWSVMDAARKQGGRKPCPTPDAALAAAEGKEE